MSAIDAVPSAVLFRKADASGGFNESYYYQALDMKRWGLDCSKKVPSSLLLTQFAEFESTILEALTTTCVLALVVPDKIRIFEDYACKSYLRDSHLEKLLWDARIVSSIGRQAAAGTNTGNGDVERALFYPMFSQKFLIPVISGFAAKLAKS